MDRLPTLRRLDQTPGGRFLSLLDGEPVGVQRPVATSSRGLPQPVLRGTPPFRVSPQPQRPIMPLEQAAMAQSMAGPRTSAPMTKLQQDLAAKMGLTGAAQQQRQQPSSDYGATARRQHTRLCWPVCGCCAWPATVRLSGPAYHHRTSSG